MPPVVNIAVCGDFQQLQLIPHLNRALDIGRAYYAHRVSTNARALGLSREQACNVFLQQYLLHFHARYLKQWRWGQFFPLYERLWETASLLRWKPCDVLYAAIRGSERRILERAKSEGAAILGHPITCHPSFFRAQLELEHRKLGIGGETFAEISADMDREIDLCDRIWCWSTLVRDTFVEAGFPSDRIDVMRLPTDLTLFKPAAAPPSAEPFRVACVAAVWPVKGHVYLLEAWRKLALPGAELVLAGIMNPDMRRVLAPYRGLFRYAGPLAKPDLVELYQTSSLLVLPSVQDGFGLVVNEALACGTPVIVTDHVGAKDIVQPDVNGYVVPARNSDAIADKILQIYSSATVRERLRTGALASRTSFPDMAEAIAMLAGLCNQVALEPRRTADIRQ